MSVFCSSCCVPLVCLSLYASVIPQSDLVHWAKSIATLLEPKPRGSAAALYSLTHQKHRHRIMQWSSRQWFRLTNINSSPGAISNEAWDFSNTEINRERHRLEVAERHCSEGENREENVPGEHVKSTLSSLWSAKSVQPHLWWKQWKTALQKYCL